MSELQLQLKCLKIANYPRKKLYKLKTYLEINLEQKILKLYDKLYTWVL